VLTNNVYTIWHNARYSFGVSGLGGFALTDTLNDIVEGCKNSFPIGDFPPFGIELGFTTDADFIPAFLMEFTLGASLS